MARTRHLVTRTARLRHPTPSDGWLQDRHGPYPDTHNPPDPDRIDAPRQPHRDRQHLPGPDFTKSLNLGKTRHTDQKHGKQEAETTLGRGTAATPWRRPMLGGNEGPQERHHRGHRLCEQQEDGPSLHGQGSVRHRSDHVGGVEDHHRPQDMDTSKELEGRTAWYPPAATLREPCCCSVFSF